MAKAEYKSTLCGCQVDAWQHLCHPGLTSTCRPICPWDKGGLGEQALGSANIAPGREGTAAGRVELEEWSQVCGQGAKGLFETEGRDKLGNKVVVIGQEGEKACGVHRSQRGWLGSGWGKQCRRSLGGAGGPGMCQKVLLFHCSRQAFPAGKPAGSWEGQERYGAMPAGRDRRGMYGQGSLPWPCCSVSTGDWKWESSKLW